jgi:hypothetical protein
LPPDVHSFVVLFSAAVVGDRWAHGLLADLLVCRLRYLRAENFGWDIALDALEGIGVGLGGQKGDGEADCSE